MNRRPLALLCLAAVIFFCAAKGAGASRREAAFSALEGNLADAAEAVAAVTFDGTVADVQAQTEGVRLSVNSIQIYTKDKSDILFSSEMPSEIKFILTTDREDFLPGDRIRVTGSYRPFSSARNPGEFDARQYYFAMDTVGRITDPVITLLSEGSFSVKRMLTRFRTALRHSYQNILEEKAARTISAISLGEKSLMEKEQNLLFQEGGISHILSVSGLHISLIGMFLYTLLRRLGLPFAAAAVPSGLAAAAYALMTGSSVSAVRACIMFVIWLGAQILGRKRDMLTALAIAAAAVLAADARQIQKSSFFLSFGAILAIVLLVPRLQELNPFSEKKLPKNGRRKEHAGLRSCGKQLWNACSGGAGIWLGMLPIVLWFYYQSAPWSLLINLAVIPLMSAVMAFGLSSCLIGLISVPAGTFLAGPVYYLLGLFEGLCRAEQQLPGALWIAGRPALWKTAVYYALFAGAAAAAGWLRHPCADQKGICRKPAEGHKRQLFRKDRSFSGDGKRDGPLRAVSLRLPLLLWGVAVLSGLCLMGLHTRSSLRVISLDVGQGDGALLQFPDGTNCLIDCGSSSEKNIWEYRISRTIRYYGISRIDYIFLSHAHDDHMNGAEEYLAEYLPGFAGKNAHGISLENLVLPPTEDAEDFADLKERAQMLGISVLQMKAGGSIANLQGGTGDAAAGEEKKALAGSRLFGGAMPWSITCLAPEDADLTGDKNEDSMVLLLRYGSFRMLFTGDLEGEAERRLTASGWDLSCDVLKVGHHGSKGGSSDSFLKAASPSAGILSCAAHNVRTVTSIQHM